MRIVTAPIDHDADLFLDCCCCGALYRAKRVRMRIRRGEAFLGEICPECVLRGPKAAAGCLKERARVLSRGIADAPLGKGSAAMQAWSRIMEENIGALESMEAFPLAARQAALRETREKR